MSRDPPLSKSQESFAVQPEVPDAPAAPAVPVAKALPPVPVQGVLVAKASAPAAPQVEDVIPQTPPPAVRRGSPLALVAAPPSAPKTSDKPV